MWLPGRRGARRRVRGRVRQRGVEPISPPGTHYIFVSEDDTTPGRTAVDYTLDLSFTPLPRLTLAPDPVDPRLRLPLAVDVEGRPLPLPPNLRVEMSTNIGDPRSWEPLDIRVEQEETAIGLLLPAVQKVREAYFRVHHDDPQYTE